MSIVMMGVSEWCRNMRVSWAFDMKLIYVEKVVVFLRAGCFWICKKHISPDYARLYPGFTLPVYTQPKYMVDGLVSGLT